MSAIKNTEVQMLDLDAVLPQSEFVIKFKGVDHKLEAVSVEGFIENLREMKKLSAVANTEDEINGMVRLLSRAFPTIGEQALREMPMFKLYKILDFANGNSGADEVAQAAAKDAEQENPQTAG